MGLKQEVHRPHCSPDDKVPDCRIQILKKMGKIKRTVINIEKATVSPQWQYVATINMLPAQCCFNIDNMMYAQQP